jgi:hypothetical protein
VPTFCLLNKDGFAVTVKGEDGSPTCAWYTDPNEASAVLAAAIRDNPTVQGLHLGVAPLGVAFRCRPFYRGEENGTGHWDMKDDPTWAAALPAWAINGESRFGSQRRV